MGNKLLSFDENTINEFLGLENVGIGTKMRILALLPLGLENIPICQFWAIFEPILLHSPNIFVTELLDLAENTINEFLGL